MRLDLLPIIGSENFPLRPSKLDRLVRCTMSVVLDDGYDDSGIAADTGNVFHAAAAAFHLNPGTLDERIMSAWAAVAPALTKFRLADEKEVRLFLTPYLADPRNQNAKIAEYKDASGQSQKAIEMPIQVVLPPHASDKTKQPVIIRGTLDSIREEAGQQWVADYKTGKPDGWDMVHDHFYQQAAYLLGAHQSGKFPRLAGARLMRIYSYRARGAALPSPEGVVWNMPYSVSDLPVIMDRVTKAVAELRNGQADFGPSDACRFCPQGGVFNCLPRAKRDFGF